MGMVDESMLPTALTVLEAGSQQGPKDPSQLDWLQYHHKKEGVENLLFWMGANNALGTVTSLNINQTSDDGTAFDEGSEKVSYEKRKGWNLWHPGDFRKEYEYMLKKVRDIMEDNPNNTDYKVFIGTVPLVTIVPLTKSAGRLEKPCAYGQERDPKTYTACLLIWTLLPLFCVC